MSPLFTDEEIGVESEFPCVYHAPGTWGWTVQEADALFKRFDEWLFCDMINAKSGKVMKRKGVAFAVDTEHSQVRGTYDDVFLTKPVSAFSHPHSTDDDDGHCDGPTLPLKDAKTPPEVLGLQKALTAYIRTMPGYEARTVNYLSIMKYVDHTVGIDWHKHTEDDGIDTPLFIVSTGVHRPFHVGRINKTKPPKPTERWSKVAEHGSLIVVPASFNDTHWHAILPENYPCGIRISVNTKCLIRPKVFSIKQKHPRFAKYVGCRYPGIYDKKPEPIVREGTPYGNDYKPFEGHRSPIAYNEEAFRTYAEKKMADPAFREQAIKDLRGKHLLCWCIQDGPKREEFCHARVWREIVNRPEYGNDISASNS